MITLLPNRYVLEKVTRDDLVIASLAWGFTLGIGWLTTWTAIQQTVNVYKRRGRAAFRNAYVWMIWLEISVCLGFGVICFMYLLGIIPPSFAFYFCILTLWALQVQFLLQIIVNRCAILIHDQRVTWRLKYGVAALITAINISVYCIWVPARLQISDTYVNINHVWDRCEKVIYLIVDACLNMFFIRIVKENLIKLGLQKYNNLVKFNMFIIGFSLSMDVLIVAMMSLNNTFVYMQFHPLAYIVKLNIEMSMASLIAKIARSSDNRDDSSYPRSRSHGTRPGAAEATLNGRTTTNHDTSRSMDWPVVTTTVEMHTLDAKRPGGKEQLGFNHNDTDTLLNQSAPYSVQIEGAYKGSGASSIKNGEGSLSSRDSEGIEPMSSR